MIEQHLGKVGELTLDPPPQVGEIIVGRIKDDGHCKWLIFEVDTIEEITTTRLSYDSY